MKHLERMLVCGLALFCVCASTVRSEDTAAAKEIQELSGINRGLCLHLGCGHEGSAGLSAALAANPSLSVHGLALDDAALARTCAAVEAASVCGRAVIDKLSGKKLPYLDHLANLAVVEDAAALEGAGIAKEEILRVLAPYGVLVSKEGGKWTKTVKPQPKGMDTWTHIYHGADYNPVSADTHIKLTFGIKWIDGIPFCLNRWASTRGIVAAGGRVYVVGSNEYENLGPVMGTNHYLTARDAFNGLPLWKIDCGPASEAGAGLNFRNAAPLVTDKDGKVVYTAVKGVLSAVDGATGKILKTLKTKAVPVRLLMLDGVLVAGCWAEKTATKDEFDGGGLWPTWIPKTEAGSVEAFEVESGKPLWAKEYPAYMMMASDGLVYTLSTKGKPTTERAVAAYDLKTGEEKWRVPHTQFGELAGLQLNTCGKGFAVVSNRGRGNKTPMGSPDKGKQRGFFVLSSADGSILWKSKTGSGTFTPLIDGNLWCSKGRLDPLTGEVKGAMPIVKRKKGNRPGFGGEQSSMCATSAIVNNIQLSSRGCIHKAFDFTADPPALKRQGYFGARGACIQGFVPAYGSLYTAQNSCKCEPAQIFGFLGLSSTGPWPSSKEYAAERTVEKGPAFGAGKKTEHDPADWPTFRGNAYRSAATKQQAPGNLDLAWTAEVASPGEGILGEAWKGQVGSNLSAPVIAGGKVYVSAINDGRIVALNVATGEKVWSAVLGGRLDSPPTIVDGLCVVGCHNGWIYALSAEDGKLAWRTRLAPRERRMMAYGQVESVWPVIGTILAHEGVLYASAGRSTASDGGLVFAALNPATGAVKWTSRYKTDMYGCLNDLLSFSEEGEIVFRNRWMDPKTGKWIRKPIKGFYNISHAGRIDGTWTLVNNNNRRSGRAFNYKRHFTHLMAWNETTCFMQDYAASRKVMDDKFQWDRDKAKKAAAAKPKPAKPSRKERTRRMYDAECLWDAEGFIKGGYQVEALAVAGDTVIYAGRIIDRKAKKWSFFLRLGSAADGKKILEIPLETEPTYDGLAVAQGKIFISLKNGKLLCLGKQG